MQYFFSDGYMIRIKKIKNEEDFKRYSPILQEFEKEFNYLLGSRQYTIAHGKETGDYFSFFKRLGDIYYFIIQDENNKVVGVGTNILKTITDNNETYKYWYLTDFKFTKEYRKTGLLKKILIKYFLSTYLKCQRMVNINMSSKKNNRILSKIKTLFSWFNIKDTSYYFYEWDYYKFISEISNNYFIHNNYLLYTNNGVKDVIINGESKPIYHLVEKEYGRKNYPDHVFEINDVNLSQLPQDAFFMLGTVKKSQVNKLTKAKIRFHYEGSFISHRMKTDECSFFSGEI
tara:strand:- start:5834 stop:6694 length:861 start_codon:yes stop_codon:yes gene_type:complete